ncbi:thiocillin family RiPP [Krasilnikovia sp. MM14-A1259]|uniref:thiocillin family RiPP n=1 Tax=Krasilnikovia sp. MM14-A1259 TaxID=3373539 RepID=UPI0037F53464
MNDADLDLFAEDLNLAVDELPADVALSSVGTISSVDCFSCPLSTASSNGTASSAG